MTARDRPSGHVVGTLALVFDYGHHHLNRRSRPGVRARLSSSRSRRELAALCSPASHSVRTDAARLAPRLAPGMLRLEDTSGRRLRMLWARDARRPELMKPLLVSARGPGWAAERTPCIPTGSRDEDWGMGARYGRPPHSGCRCLPRRIRHSRSQEGLGLELTTRALGAISRHPSVRG